MNADERFAILNDFIGYGNPEGKFWFIGLEEHGNWEESPNVDQEIEKFKNRILCDNAGEPKGKTKVYEIMSKIVLSAKDRPLDKWQEYIVNELLVKDGETFQMNLFPLGKNNWDYWPAEGSYKRLFNFDSRGQYLQKVKDSKRFEKLRDEWSLDRKQTKVTICFGANQWESFKTSLNLSGLPEIDTWYRTYPSEKVILCPFFSGRPNCFGANDEKISTIGNEVKRLLGGAPSL